MKKAWILLATVCVLVIGTYVFLSQSGVVELVSPDAADTHYNLLVQGFRTGQLNLKKEVPPGFAQLADPYDPDANAVYQPPPYRLLDLSYYKGKFYLYWGITPALILFWPYVALTGHYLFHRQAVAIFCMLGFLASMGLLHGLWRRYFAEVSVGVVAACALALGLATGVPVLLASSDVYEVAISCGYMLTMLALAAIWRALHETERKCRWLAVASVAYGLAVGARPSLLFGAVILLVPVIHVWREGRRRIGVQLLSATGPIVLIGLGLMLYNARRFDNPFEFGEHYMVSVERQTRQLFSLRYLWFNFRVYFLEPARWSVHSPFVHGAIVPPLPTGYSGVRNSFGVLTSNPVAWLALVVPLAWRNRSEQAGSTLRWFVTALVLMFVACALTVGLFWTANFRYAVDFLPTLILLAVVGILGLERALAQQPGRRCVLRWVWGILLGVSVAFNLLATVAYDAEAQNGMGTTLFRMGKTQEAMSHWERALRINPDYAEAHDDLALALSRMGRVPEAMEHWEQSLRLRPDIAETHYNLGIALEQAGRLQEAIAQYEQAVSLKPDYAEAHCNLGATFEKTGRIEDAIEQYEQALRLKPNYAQAHYNLGVSLIQQGRVQEAMAHWEEAVRIKPDYADAHNNLGNALLQGGRIDDAIGHYEQALRINPDLAEAHGNLGVALEKADRPQEAIGQYEQALRLKPGYAQARDALARLRAGQ